MNTIKTKFSGKTTLIFLAINWIAMIALTVYFLGEKNEMSMSIVGTLLIGFVLQLSLMCDQLKRKNKEA